MNVFAKASALALFALFPLASACGDDNDENEDGNAGGSGGGAGASNTQCVGVYADRTAAELAEQTTEGACVDDTQAVCASDIHTRAGTCGVGCASQGGGEAEQASCTLACLRNSPNPDPSDACYVCYIESVGCAYTNCFDQCVESPTAPACIACRADEGCTAGFYTCSGLPVPGSVPSMAGSGGAQ